MESYQGEASESRFGFCATCLGFRVESDACTSSFIYANEAIESASLLLSQQIMSSCAPGPSPRIRGAAEELLFDSFLSLSVFQNGFDIERVKNLMNTQLQSSFGTFFSWNDHSPDLARDSLSQLSQTLRGILHVDGTCEEFSSFSSGDKLSNDDENFLRELVTDFFFLFFSPCLLMFAFEIRLVIHIHSATPLPFAFSSTPRCFQLLCVC